MIRATAVLLALCTVAACGESHAAPDAALPVWRLGPQLPTPRLEPGVTALGQQLVIVGGWDTDLQAGLHITTKVDVLDTTTGVWNATPLPDAPVAWTHLQLAAIGTTLYLLGGLGYQDNATFPAHGESWKLNTLVQPLAWQPIATMPAGYERGSAAVVVAPPRIYLLGGASTTDALATNLYYDISTNTWGTDLPDLPAPRSHPAGMIRTDGTLVVAGGLSGLYADTAQADVWQLTPGASAWAPGTPMPLQRGGCAYGVLQGALACAGGEAGTSALSYVQSYNPIDDTWTDGPMMPAPTAGTQGAAIAQQLYVPGGARRIVFEPTSTLYVYAPLNAAQ